VTESLITADWLNLLASQGKLLVGFSGGLDSTVLLHTLAQHPALRAKLCAVYINHGLSSHANCWQIHCQQFCTIYAIPLLIETIEFIRTANIEEEARNARYLAFAALLQPDDCLLLAHHCDDQAETLLLQLLRGAGIDGLAAMSAEKPFASGKLCRPLLQHSRQTLSDYAQLHNLTWVDDESNQDSVYSRNYLRQQIMPLLRARWPGAVGNLVRTTQHCQQAKNNLQALAYLDCAELVPQHNTLPIPILRTLAHDRLSNVLRTWLKNNEIRLPPTTIFNRLLSEVVFADVDAQPCVQWGGVKVLRYQQTLYLLKNNQQYVPSPVLWTHFPKPVNLAGGGYLQARVVACAGVRIASTSEVRVDFRRGGETFQWHGQTKQLKKLWQEWQIPPWERDSIPLIYIDNCLAIVVGFAISDQYYQENCVDSLYVIDWHKE